MESDSGVLNANNNENLIAPKVIHDISHWPYMVVKGKQYYCIGSKEVDRYLKIDEDNLQGILSAIEMMDGNNTIDSIQKYLLEKKKIHMDTNVLYQKLFKAGLIEGSDASTSNSEISLMGVNLINVKFKELSERKRKIYSYIWNFLFVSSILIAIVAIAGIIIKQDKFVNFLNQSLVFKDSYLLGAIITSLVSIGVIFIHETAHAITSIRLGLQPTEFRMVLYGGISPMWMVKIRGMYTVPRKKRIAIMGAGLISNLVIILLAMSLVLWTDLSLYTNQLLSKIALSSYFMIIVCISPFYLSDGYFIMTQILKLSNLRIKIIRAIKNAIKNRKEKLEPVVLIYFIISMGLMISSIYYSVLWSINISKELYHAVKIEYVNYIAAAIPFLVTFTTIFLFVKRFIKLIKED